MPIHMRSCHEHACAAGCGPARDCQRALDRRRPVVDAGQYVGVEIYHVSGNVRACRHPLDYAARDELEYADMIIGQQPGRALQHTRAGEGVGVMFKSIVVGTDGSETAGEAVRQAGDLAHTLGATLEIVSAYEPVPAGACARNGATPRRTCSGRSTRARTSMRRSRPPRRRRARRASRSTSTLARAIPPTRSWTSPRSAARI